MQFNVLARLKDSLLRTIKPVYESFSRDGHNFIKIGKLSIHTLSRPALMISVLRNREVFQSPPFVRETFREVVGYSMINARTENDWKARHDAYKSSFSPEAVRNKIAPNIVAECSSMIDRVIAQKRPVNVEKEMLAMTGQVIVKTIFGNTMAEEKGRDLISIISETLRTAGKPSYLGRTLKKIGLPFNHAGFLLSLALVALDVTDDYPARVPAKILEAIDRIALIIKPVIQDRRNLQTQPDDVIGHLMTGSEHDLNLNDQEICDEVVMLTGAGHDTTASTLTFAIQEVAGDPELAQKIRAEFNSLLKGSVIDGSRYASMSLTMSTFKEACRLYSPVASAVRYAVKSHQAQDEKDISVRDKDLMIVDFRKMLKSKVWDRPETFIADRFLHASTPPHAFLAFGAGSHTCLGMKMAEAEGALVLGMLCHRFDMKIVQRLEGQKQFFTLQPKGKLIVEFTERSQPFEITAPDKAIQHCLEEPPATPLSGCPLHNIPGASRLMELLK